jgi:hypothetical protein
MVGYDKNQLLNKWETKNGTIKSGLIYKSESPPLPSSLSVGHSTLKKVSSS